MASKNKLTEDDIQLETYEGPVEIDINSIIITDTRQRQDLGDLYNLKESIKERGTIQPIIVHAEVVQGEGYRYTLVAGERRITSCKELGYSHLYYGSACSPKRPGFLVGTLLADAADRELIELEENFWRKSMTWQEMVLAIDRIHSMQSKKARTKLSYVKWTNATTGELLGCSAGKVQYCLKLADSLKLNDEEIKSCGSMREALGLLVKRAADLSYKELLRLRQFSPTETAGKTLASAGTDLIIEMSNRPTPTPLLQGGLAQPLTFVEGISSTITADEAAELTKVGIEPFQIELQKICANFDCTEWMKSQNFESVDHIITDPPYGIDMTNLADNVDINRVKDTHQVAENVSLLEAFIPMAYNVLRDKGYLVMFIDLEHFEKIRDWCLKAKFKVQRWPVIWHKTTNCKNDAATFNTTKDYESLIICRKGVGTLRTLRQSSVIRLNPDEEKAHKITSNNPFSKPFPLWKWILETVAMPTQSILDPFAGEGSLADCAITLGFHPVSVEKEATHYARLVERVATKYQSVYGDKVTIK